MTMLFDSPARFADDALEGFCDAHSDLVRQVPGGAVRADDLADGQVAVIYGGGSGHYPAFAGVVGPGMGAGAVVGNIFTSPSAQRAVSVANEIEAGGGVVFSYGNYAGDVMNFGLASEELAATGIRVENVIVTDDIASAPRGRESERRGIAGDFTVFKVMGAASERGDSFDEVVRLGRKANDATRTLGTAFKGCTFPGADAPLFEVPEGQMGWGLGIHGEPGVEDRPLPSATELATMLVEQLLEDRPDRAGDRVVAILNGLGSTKYEELYVVWRVVAPLLREAGLSIVANEVGELVTSLDMAGMSLTLMYVDEELEELWHAPALTPAYQRGRVERSAATHAQRAHAVQERVGRAAGTVESREAGAAALALLELAERTMRDAEPMLGDIDAIAGDGDHGRGMVRGTAAAVAGAREAAAQGAGLGSLLAAAGAAWGDDAGGTSGVLWGAALSAAGAVLGDHDAPGSDVAVRAARAFLDRLTALGGAQPGDKTMVDAVVPFVESLEATQEAGAADWIAAARAATEAAQVTAGLRPQKGRARPLAERSVGTPDPGATSFALLATALVNAALATATPAVAEKEI